MIDTKLLRQKLIDMAMRGLLVEQRQEEGNASDLLEEIRAEKAALIKKGQIKKEKPLPEIKEEEKPFAIPANWCWVRLGEIVSNNGQRVPDSTFVYIDIGSIDNNNHCLNKENKILEPCDAPSRARKIVQFGDLLYSTVRPYLHNICIIDRNFPYMPIASTGFAVMSCKSQVINKYLFFCLISAYFDKYVNKGENSRGALYPAIPEKKFYEGIIPLPPLAEQKRIVAALEASLKLVDTIAKDSADLDKALNFLRQKVLDMAMRGLLVEQRSEEGNASDLLEQIRVEKAALIKKGQIKKEKPLPEIKEEEKPFAIPDSWCWVRLGEIFKLINGDRGKNYPAKSSLNTEGIPFISAVNLDGRTVVKDEKLLCVSEEQYNKLGSGKLRCGDIVLCIRGSLGKHGRYPFDIGAIASSLVILRNMSSDEEISTRYLMNYLDASLFYSEIDKYDNGTAQPNLAADSVKKLLVPLPPLAEQKRIVAKLEQINALIETALN